ncbi:MAG: MYXO-CTERM domain-containing protein [Myxococcota bacterium]|jgi:MYXO-CTERM domain-containing protein
MRIIFLPISLLIALPALANEPPTTTGFATLSAFEDRDATVQLQGSDADGDTLTYRIVHVPDHGEMVQQAGLWLYRPEAHFHGTDSFSYAVSDGMEESAAASVIVSIAPTQDEVVAQPHSVETHEEQGTSFTLGATADGGVRVTWELLEGPRSGVLQGEDQLFGDSTPTLHYTPNTDFFGSDRIVVAAYDRGSPIASIIEVPIRVFGTPDTPSSVRLMSPDYGAEVTTVRPTLQWSTASDADGDVLSYGARVWNMATNDMVASASGFRSSGSVVQWRPSVELTPGALYAWEAYAEDDELRGALSGEGMFSVSSSNSAPSGLAFLEPVDGAILTTDAPTLVFDAAVDPESSSVFHEIEVDHTRDFSSDDRLQVSVPTNGGTESVSVADYAYALPRFSAGYARVRAVDSTGAATPWQVVGFTSGGPNGAPSEPEAAIVSDHPASDCVWSIRSVDPDADSIQYEVTKILNSDDVSTTAFYDVGSPDVIYACPRSAAGEVQGVWVRAVDEFGAASQWAFASPQKVADRTASSCSSVPAPLGLFPLGLLLLGLRRRRS